MVLKQNKLDKKKKMNRIKSAYNSRSSFEIKKTSFTMYYLKYFKMFLAVSIFSMLILQEFLNVLSIFPAKY